MGRNFMKTSFIFAIVILLFSCGSSTVKIVRSSSEQMPKWIFSRPADSHNLYFVGHGDGASSIKEGREKAVADAVYQVVQYIGFRVKTHRKDVRKMSEGDNGGSYEWKLQQTLEGKGDAKVSVNIDDFYFEEYSNGKVNVTVLLKISKKWVEKERKRLLILAKSRRKEAIKELEQAKVELENRRTVSALQKAVQAWALSEQAVENADLMDEAKQLIVGIINGWSVTLINQPKYAYREGGSDPIEIKIQNADSRRSARGIATALFPVKSGVFYTDKFGKARLTIEEPLSSDQVKVKVGWALIPFAKIQEADDEFYDEIKRQRERSAVVLQLKVAERSKVLPTVIFAYRLMYDTKRKKFGAPQTAPDLRQSVESLLVERGYSVRVVSTKDFRLGYARSLEALRNVLIKETFRVYGNSGRAVIVVESVVPLENTAVAYGSDLKSVEVKLSLALVNLSNGELQKILEGVTRKPGINTGQAVSIAESYLIRKKIKPKMREF